MDRAAAKTRLVAVVRALAAEKRAELNRLKEEHTGLARPDFIWHYLLQSFSTMGRASGWHGLIGNQDNYRRVTYTALAALTPGDRVAQVRHVCQVAGVRMPDKKAEYILGCFDCVTRLGGPEPAKARLLAQSGREAKIAFLQSFPGIGPKYARNIMMDVYHEDFRDSIALDVRIKAISAEQARARFRRATRGRPVAAQPDGPPSDRVGPGSVRWTRRTVCCSRPAGHEALPRVIAHPAPPVTTAFDQGNRLGPLSKVKLLSENLDVVVMSETSLNTMRFCPP